MKYKSMMVFDENQMPYDLRLIRYDPDRLSTVSFYAFTPRLEGGGTMSQWLLENGANDGEEVLIKLY